MLRMSGVSLIGCQMRRRLFPLACPAPIIFLSGLERLRQNRDGDSCSVRCLSSSNLATNPGTIGAFAEKADATELIGW